MPASRLRWSSIADESRQTFRDHATYLAIAFATPPLATLAQYSLGGEVSLLGHGPSVLVSCIGMFVAFAAWLPYRKRRGLDFTSLIIVTLILAVWLIQVVRTRFEGVTGLDFSVYALPVLLIMVLLKPPQLQDVRRSAQVFGLTVVAVVATTLLLDFVDVGETAFVSTNGISRLPLLTDLLGVDSRWSGAFVHSNLAGPIGGALVILATSARFRLRWVILAGGITLVILSQSRTGIAATAVALSVLGLVRAFRSSNLNARWISGIGAALVVIGSATYIVAFDPTLAWRTYAWLDFLDLWVTAPLTGVGDQGVTAYFLSGPLHGPVAFTHGHNLLFDQAARFGLVLMILTAAILILMTTQAARAVNYGEYTALPLAVLTFTLAIVEVPFSWAYLSTLMIPALLAIMLGAAAVMGASASKHPEDAIHATH